MEFLNTKEAAKELGISPGSLHRRCNERKIRFTTHDGRSRLFTPEWLQEYTNSQTQPPLDFDTSTKTGFLSKSEAKLKSPKAQDSSEDWESLKECVKKKQTPS